MRKAPTLTEKLAAVLPRIRCSYCGEPLTDPIQWDHVDFVALGGTNASLDPLHQECHRKKTNGIPHIPLSGDVSKIAKVKRIARKHDDHKAARDKLLARDDDHQAQAELRRRYKWPKRPFARKPTKNSSREPQR